MTAQGAMLGAYVAALVAGVVLAVGAVATLPGWLAGGALLVVAAAFVTIFAAAWHEARATGAAFVRTLARATWRTLRLLLSAMP